MRPKIFVATSLMLALLVSGIILIYGYASSKLLPLYLLIFLLGFLAITIYLIRQSLEDKMIITIILLTIVAISSTIFLTNLKNYYDATNNYGNPDTNQEINWLQAQNEYSAAYAEYLTQRVSTYQDRSKSMNLQLIELEKIKSEKENQANTVTAPIMQEIAPEPEYIYYDYEEYEDEEDDD